MQNNKSNNHSTLTSPKVQQQLETPLKIMVPDLLAKPFVREKIKPLTPKKRNPHTSARNVPISKAVKINNLSLEL